MWRIAKIVLALYLAANLIAAYFFWHRIDQFLNYMPRVKPATFSAPINTLEAQRQDFSYLETVLNYDRSFSSEARDQFKARIASLKSQERVLSPAEFYLSVRELMALADNGHTSVASGPAFRVFNRSGIDLYQFSDGHYIVRAHKNYASLVGQKITKIDGQPIEDVITSLRQYTGGPDNWRDLQSLYLIRSPELLHAAGLVESPDQIEITVKNEIGEVIHTNLQALAPVGDTDYFRHASMTLSPEALSDEQNDWTRTLEAGQDNIAPYLENMSDSVLTRQFGGGLYVRSSYLLDSTNRPVKKMLLESFNQAEDTGYGFIVVDLRWNPGGDYGNAVPFAQQVKSALVEDGMIYVITGPNTFSAAIVFSALIKQSAPEQTLIIGEPMGDRPQFWAERGKSFVLPNSDYWINYATGYHDWENGCAKTHRYCFPPNKRLEQKIDSLQIDHTLMPSYANYASGKDVVMDWILANEARKD